MFLQGLIQISAALLKWHQQKAAGVRKLSTAGLTKLKTVNLNMKKPLIYGINLAEYITRLQVFFEPYMNIKSTYNWKIQNVHPLIVLNTENLSN